MPVKKVNAQVVYTEDANFAPIGATITIMVNTDLPSEESATSTVSDQPVSQLHPLTTEN